MKRLTISIFSLLLVIGSAMLLTSPSVHADATKQQKAAATACSKKYDGKTYANDSSQLDGFNHSDCADHTTGNCIAQGINSSNTKITCNKNYGSNAKHDYGDGGNGGTTGGGDTAGETVDPAIAYANTDCNEDSCSFISKFVNPIIDLLTILVGLAVTIGIIVGGIQVSTSGGDPQKAASGKNHIRNALIAIVGYLLLFGFLSWLVPGGIV